MTRAGTEPGAWAVVRGEEPTVFLAENATVLSRLLAFKLVAESDPAVFEPGQLEAVRAALLAEQWAEAVLLWMTATGQVVDVYDGWLQVWNESDLDADRAAMEIRLARIFG